MSDKQLTKSQRRRARERARKESERHLREILGPVPEYILQDGREHGNLDVLDPVSPWERAPVHMVSAFSDGSGWTIDDQKQAELTRAASESRIETCEQTAADLKLAYPQYWGKPGGAGKIVNAERGLGNEPPSRRTIERYFNKFP